MPQCLEHINDSLFCDIFGGGVTSTMLFAFFMNSHLPKVNTPLISTKVSRRILVREYQIVANLSCGLYRRQR